MDDLISRQAVIDEIENELEMINSALDSMTLDFNARERLRQRKGEAREILNSIQQLPSAQKIGKWIKHEYAEELEGLLIPNYECSECHTWVRKESNYCSHCGAKMDAEREEDD